MVSYLDSAFSEASGMYANCKAAAASSPQVLTSGHVGIGYHHSGLSKAKEQISHYRGYVYAAIKAVATRVAAQNFSMGKVAGRPTGKKIVDLPKHIKHLGDNLEPMPSHPFLDCLNCPNPLLVRWSLLYSLTSSLLLTGKSFLWVTEAENGLQCWPIPASWIEPADLMRGTWKLRPFGAGEEIELPNEQICCVMLPSPGSPFDSVSPLQAVAHPVAIDEEIQHAQYRTFKNGIFPGVMVRVGRMPGFAGEKGERPILSGGQRREVIDAIMKMYNSTTGKNAPLVVDGMIESVEKLTNTPEEMDFLGSGKAVKSRILEAFGVSPAVLGQLENSNRAAAAVAEANFCANTVNPLIELMSESLTKFCQTYYSDKRLVCWITAASADDRELTLQAWRDAKDASFISQNEYRRFILNLPDVPGGDVFRDMMGNPLGTESEPEKTFHLNGHARV